MRQRPQVRGESALRIDEGCDLTRHKTPTIPLMKHGSVRPHQDLDQGLNRPRAEL